MNKKLLLAAFSAALVAPLAANAGITVYGHMNAELAQETSVIDTNGDGVNNGDDHGGFTVEDNARGRVGIKGSEDLGGGLKGIAQAEWKIDTTQGGQGVGQRVAYAGLKGGFGTFQIGKLKTPYKYFGGVKYDPFVTTNLEARKNGGMSGGSAGKFDGADASSSFGHNSFQADSLGYISPNWGGLKIWAVLGLDQKGDDRNKEDTCTDDDGCTGAGGGNYGDYQLGLKYGMKGAVPWEVGFVQNLNASRDDTTAGRGDVVAFKVFGSVGFKTGGLKHKIVLQNEGITESQNAAGASERTEGLLFLGYHLGLGKTTIVAQGSTGVVDYDVVGGEDQTVQYLAVGAVHKFSKKTRVYGGYRSSTWTDFGGTLDAEKAETAITVGIRKDL
ncbi:MAG: trimeric porin PorB [Gammaproteobacteria bacterium]|nr:MAG: trimeric porin PorB [Gammaproteobacteria bacterium]